MQTLRSQLQHPPCGSPFLYPHLDKTRHLTLAPCRPKKEKKSIWFNRKIREQRRFSFKERSIFQGACSIQNFEDFHRKIISVTYNEYSLSSEMMKKIEEKFSDMINNSKGRKDYEKLTNFMISYFESKDCKIKLKLVESD